MHCYFIQQYSPGAAVFNLDASASISYSYQKDKVKTEITQFVENLSSTIQHNINGLIYLYNNMTSLTKMIQNLSIKCFVYH